MIYVIIVMAVIIAFDTAVIYSQSQLIDDLSDKYLDAAGELDPPEVVQWDYTKEKGWSDLSDDDFYT